MTVTNAWWTTSTADTRSYDTRIYYAPSYSNLDWEPVTNVDRISITYDEMYRTPVTPPPERDYP